MTYTPVPVFPDSTGSHAVDSKTPDGWAGQSNGISESEDDDDDTKSWTSAHSEVEKDEVQVIDEPHSTSPSDAHALEPYPQPSETKVNMFEPMEVDSEPLVNTQIHHAEKLDLAYRIPGLHRVLDLISESGSGGLVDKIIIAQESLERLINELSPGAYSSLTKVDFKTLDTLDVKPLGIYGSKDEIVGFLLKRGVIKDDVALILKQSVSNASAPYLRSGLYVLRAPLESEQIFLVYWPELTTWNDDALSSVKRNRVTFMRYLTKLADQVVCLVSSEHARSIVWNEDSDGLETPIGLDLDLQEASDRMFSFEVAKTNEQEEDVSTREGFETILRGVAAEPTSHEKCTLDNADLEPTLIRGETSFALLTKRYVEGRAEERLIRGEKNNPAQLKRLLDDGTIRIADGANDETLDILRENGLGKRYPGPFEAWRARNRVSKDSSDAASKEELQKVEKHVAKSMSELEIVIREAICDRTLKMFPTIQRSALSPNDGEQLEHLRAQYQNFLALHPQVQDELEKTASPADRSSGPKINLPRFRTLKESILCVRLILREQQTLEAEDRKDLIAHVTDHGVESLTSALVKTKRQDDAKPKGFWTKITAWFTESDSTNPEDRIRKQLKESLASTPDAAFLQSLNDVLGEIPALEDMISRAIEAAVEGLNESIGKALKRTMARAQFVQEAALKAQIQRDQAVKLEAERRSSRMLFLKEYDQEVADSPSVMLIGKIESQTSTYPSHTPSLYRLYAVQKTVSKPTVECNVHSVQLTTEDRHSMQLDPTFVPTPRFQPSRTQTFSLGLVHRIVLAQLIQVRDSDKLLFVIEDAEHLCVFLDSPSNIGQAISRGRAGAKKLLHRDKIGKDVLLAYNEQKRMLMICAASQLKLHLYLFDEMLGALSAWGSPVDLNPWYSSGTAIVHSCFVLGSEEILFIDTGAQARIFSLVTQQFRPASLTLELIPTALHTSPDGACLILAFGSGDGVVHRAYHWDTFGSSQGIELGVVDIPTGPTVLTSFVNRRSAHLVSLDPAVSRCRSVALDITKKTTEFMFQATGGKATSSSQTQDTAHNCLIDVHADVWSRFPVVAAVQRQTISTSGDARRSRQLVFRTDRDRDRYAPHFAELISAFEQRTKKPTGDALKSIRVSAADSLSLDPAHISRFRAGEWLVDLLCLIPIQIAVTRENRFLPLKDGIMSAELERSLLGAEVGQIVDALSFGWYESVFQSYMTAKKVKVVSSMGEQSVGKSFALNHLVDSSFAGSAMRTTEGVWMSVTPTDEALIVALDFEGVHSIERSAQEDTLLVLFNTAISNLVLFRNNFAISRNITGLFQSFQSSSTVLDPAANPSLFKSTLTIIIKDVVESDKTEIVREFSTKFTNIVREEQDANFISRLHAGQLNIVPWPVIESKGFYTLFPAVKKLLDKQTVTHKTAGEFLHTLKTLMAKLKANDWGSLSQTLVAHRAQKLLAGLPSALMLGYLEADEPLKNFDTDEPIEEPDTFAQFFLPSTVEDATAQSQMRERALAELQRSWAQYSSRHTASEGEWVTGLAQFLEQLTEERIRRVFAWISSNLSRFQTSHDNAEHLRRMFESEIVDMKGGVEMCGVQCSACQLRCLLSRRHDLSEGKHDCRTDHMCQHVCEFADEHPGEEKNCGLPAGHSGGHICAVDFHLCGQPCALQDKSGCMQSCMKVAHHAADEGHLCNARLHKCGEPCALMNVTVKGSNEQHSCSRTCAVSSDEPHSQHACDSSTCPLPCELCKRLCANTDHLHGLIRGAVHLCGQSHNCSALCQADGTCEIATAPQSIEATFTGKHETFQYTKYSQVAKRLRCVHPIPAGERQHAGKHSHSTDPAPFHFCETRCEYCGYFCTLPRNHPQQEHETHHGSMSRSSWSIDGPDGSVLELNGHKFGSEDDGAPMMCNLYCHEMGRHVHLDYCRADDKSTCNDAHTQHLSARMMPNPDKAKDWISHSLYWQRSGFKDPYSRPDQLNFSKCDAMCPDTEHAATANNPAHPSYCTLPLFHPPATQASGLGYVSNDGHVFNCKNPAVMQQAFHVIFVIDRSGSMGSTDRRPLPGTPSTALIQQTANNRLGAVYSALHGFWISRTTALGASQGTAPVRRDAYSVVLFDHAPTVCIANDFAHSPDELLHAMLPYHAGGGTNFTAAMQTAQTLVRDHWSAERSPVVIFLSDGECHVADETVQDACRGAVALGRPLSFHSVSFGRDAQSATLRRMAQLALEVQRNAPVSNPLMPAAAVVDSSYSVALDTVRLAETFLGFAESLRKPRGALFKSI
ncbi:unnamed protein product [Mycena citricolor]|uniref:VWFA domain-containing protein n=1 Tax=Mycena citricolor TaxID=2018698 RepID=A0AAD2K7P8_9AGAR|nr:unnamed protein product [Mycena citricolor]